MSVCKSGLENITIVENNLSSEERMKEMCKNVLFFELAVILFELGFRLYFASKDYIGSHYLGFSSSPFFFSFFWLGIPTLPYEIFNFFEDDWFTFCLIIHIGTQMRFSVEKCVIAS